MRSALERTPRHLNNSNTTKEFDGRPKRKYWEVSKEFYLCGANECLSMILICNPRHPKRHFFFHIHKVVVSISHDNRSKFPVACLFSSIH
jgi:hypothetical protein